MLPRVGWHSASGLVWNWMSWAALHFCDPVRRPSLTLRLALDGSHLEDANIGAYEVFTRPHVESNPETFVPLVFELAWHKSGLGDFEMNDLPKLDKFRVRPASLHKLEGCPAGRANSAPGDQAGRMSHHPRDYRGRQSHLDSYPLFER